jgi:two-component system, OmpR family, sensor histidine kinase SenX3
VLSVLRSSALVVDRDDTVLKASAPAVALGLVREHRVAVAELADLVAQVRRDGQIRETELVVPRSAGKPPRHVSARVAPLGSSYVLALLEDRSREHRVEAVRRDFVVNVSHELKTPVGALKLLSDTVADAADDPEAVRRFAGRMHAESDRLTRLVQQIIELSRLQDDDPLDSPEAVPLDELVSSTFDDVRTDADARRISLVHEPSGLVLLGSPGQIHLALSNLVANAVKYSPEGSTVVVAAEAVGALVEVSVSDRGMGIPSSELDRIFERFYRVDRARPRATGGTGLGLSIVKHVAASHGGEVAVRSVEGEGSTFILTLPRRQTTREKARESR